jgi:hypothetical protein
LLVKCSLVCRLLPLNGNPFLYGRCRSLLYSASNSIGMTLFNKFPLILCCYDTLRFVRKVLWKTIDITYRKDFRGFKIASHDIFLLSFLHTLHKMSSSAEYLCANIEYLVYTLNFSITFYHLKKNLKYNFTIGASRRTVVAFNDYELKALVFWPEHDIVIVCHTPMLVDCICLTVGINKFLVDCFFAHINYF